MKAPDPAAVGEKLRVPVDAIARDAVEQAGAYLKASLPPGCACPSATAQPLYELLSSKGLKHGRARVVEAAVEALTELAGRSEAFRNRVLNDLLSAVSVAPAAALAPIARGLGRLLPEPGAAAALEAHPFVLCVRANRPGAWQHLLLEAQRAVEAAEADGDAAAAAVLARLEPFAAFALREPSPPPERAAMRPLVQSWLAGLAAGGGECGARALAALAAGLRWHAARPGAPLAEVAAALEEATRASSPPRAPAGRPRRALLSLLLAHGIRSARAGLPAAGAARALEAALEGAGRAPRRPSGRPPCSSRPTRGRRGRRRRRRRPPRRPRRRRAPAPADAAFARAAALLALPLAAGPAARAAIEAAAAAAETDAPGPGAESTGGGAEAPPATLRWLDGLAEAAAARRLAPPDRAALAALAFHPSAAVRARAFGPATGAALGPAALPVLLHAANRVPAAEQLGVLRCLPHLVSAASPPAALTPVIRALQPLLAVKAARPAALTLYLDLWRRTDRFFPKLLEALAGAAKEAEAGSPGDRELQLAVCGALREVARCRPRRALDALHLIQGALALREGNPAAAAGALEALDALCGADALDFYTVLRVLVSRRLLRLEGEPAPLHPLPSAPSSPSSATPPPTPPPAPPRRPRPAPPPRPAPLSAPQAAGVLRRLWAAARSEEAPRACGRRPTRLWCGRRPAGAAPRRGSPQAAFTPELVAALEAGTLEEAEEEEEEGGGEAAKAAGEAGEGEEEEPEVEPDYARYAELLRREGARGAGPALDACEALLSAAAGPELQRRGVAQWTALKPRGGDSKGGREAAGPAARPAAEAHDALLPAAARASAAAAARVRAAADAAAAGGAPLPPLVRAGAALGALHCPPGAPLARPEAARTAGEKRQRREREEAAQEAARAARRRLTDALQEPPASDWLARFAAPPAWRAFMRECLLAQAPVEFAGSPLLSAKGEAGGRWPALHEAACSLLESLLPARAALQRGPAPLTNAQALAEPPGGPAAALNAALAVGTLAAAVDDAIRAHQGAAVPVEAAAAHAVIEAAVDALLPALAARHEGADWLAFGAAAGLGFAAASLPPLETARRQAALAALADALASPSVGEWGRCGAALGLGCVLEGLAAHEEEADGPEGPRRPRARASPPPSAVPPQLTPVPRRAAAAPAASSPPTPSGPSWPPPASRPPCRPAVPSLASPRRPRRRAQGEVGGEPAAQPPPRAADGAGLLRGLVAAAAEAVDSAVEGRAAGACAALPPLLARCFALDLLSAEGVAAALAPLRAHAERALAGSSDASGPLAWASPAALATALRMLDREGYGPAAPGGPDAPRALLERWAAVVPAAAKRPPAARAAAVLAIGHALGADLVAAPAAGLPARRSGRRCRRQLRQRGGCGSCRGRWRRRGRRGGREAMEALEAVLDADADSKLRRLAAMALGAVAGLAARHAAAAAAAAGDGAGLLSGANGLPLLPTLSRLFLTAGTAAAAAAGAGGGERAALTLPNVRQGVVRCLLELVEGGPGAAAPAPGPPRASAPARPAAAADGGAAEALAGALRVLARHAASLPPLDYTPLVQRALKSGAGPRGRAAAVLLLVGRATCPAPGSPAAVARAAALLSELAEPARWPSLEPEARGAGAGRRGGTHADGGGGSSPPTSSTPAPPPPPPAARPGALWRPFAEALAEALALPSPPLHATAEAAFWALAEAAALAEPEAGAALLAGDPAACALHAGGGDAAAAAVAAALRGPRRCCGPRAPSSPRTSPPRGGPSPHAPRRRRRALAAAVRRVGGGGGAGAGAGAAAWGAGGVGRGEEAAGRGGWRRGRVTRSTSRPSPSAPTASSATSPTPPAPGPPAPPAPRRPAEGAGEGEGEGGAALAAGPSLVAEDPGEGALLGPAAVAAARAAADGLAVRLVTLASGRRLGRAARALLVATAEGMRAAGLAPSLASDAAWPQLSAAFDAACFPAP
eukprot:tig00001126_g7127.t1